MVRLSLRHRLAGKDATATPSPAAQSPGMLQLSLVLLCPVWSWLVLLVPLSFQPAKGRLWDKLSSRKPRSVSPKAPPQPSSRAPQHPRRGAGEGPCYHSSSGHQPPSTAGTGGTLQPCLDHRWRSRFLSDWPSRQTGHTCGFVCLQFVSGCLRPSRWQKRHRVHGKHEPGWLQT